jgi:hypothetical protein
VAIKHIYTGRQFAKIKILKKMEKREKRHMIGV